MNNKSKITFGYGKHVTQPDTIVMSLAGTGIDLDDPQHAQQMQAVMEVIGSLMFSIGNNIPFENIEYNIQKDNP